MAAALTRLRASLRRTSDLTSAVVKYVFLSVAYTEAGQAIKYPFDPATKSCMRTRLPPISATASAEAGDTPKRPEARAPRLTITGNLGEVMKESAVLALEYVKAHAEHLNIDYRIFEQWSLHLHVPEGATPKDGPSAGITMATSIASALTQRKVRQNIAMTGEMTLRGKVLPVGGIKEKILAAKRAGITDIVMSADNRKDIEEINEKYIEGLTFHFVENAQQVFDIALLDEKVENAFTLTVETENKEADKK